MGVKKFIGIFGNGWFNEIYKVFWWYVNYRIVRSEKLIELDFYFCNIFVFC